LLDNKNLTPFVKEILKGLSYEERINIYDKNCSSCPYNLIKITQGKRVLERCHNVDDAIKTSLDFEHTQILRLCNFNGEEYSVQEITTNTCKLWNAPEHDEGIFVEVEDVNDLRLESWLTMRNDIDLALLREEFGG